MVGMFAFALSVVGMLITLANFMVCRGWIKIKVLNLTLNRLIIQIIINAGGIVALTALSTWLLQ